MCVPSSLPLTHGAEARNSTMPTGTAEVRQNTPEIVVGAIPTEHAEHVEALQACIQSLMAVARNAAAALRCDVSKTEAAMRANDYQQRLYRLLAQIEIEQRARPLA